MPYAPAIRFVEEPWPPKIAWSLVVVKVEATNNNYDWVANVRFLVPEAPVETLRAGREFELYEGGKCVATGVIM
jgi:hypothetical protein